MINSDATIEQRLIEGYNQLAQLATIAKNNFDEWLLSEVEAQIATSRYKLSITVASFDEASSVSPWLKRA